MLGCDPVNIAARLKLAMEVFQNARTEVASQWNDEVHQRIEEQCLAPMESKLRKAVETIGHLAEMLHRAERDCS